MNFLITSFFCEKLPNEFSSFSTTFYTPFLNNANNASNTLILENCITWFSSSAISSAYVT